MSLPPVPSSGVSDAAAKAPHAADSAAQFARGAAQGGWEGAKAMAEGAKDLVATAADGYRQLAGLARDAVRDPQTREDVYNAIKAAAREAQKRAEAFADDPVGKLKSARDGLLAAGNKLIEQEKAALAEAANRGEAARHVGERLGRAAFEVGSMFIGAGEAAKAGQLAKLSKAERALGKVGAEVLPCAKAGRAESAAAKVAKSAAEIEKAAVFKPHGWVGEAMETPVGRDMVESMVAAGTDRDAAIGYVQEMLESGAELPVKKTLEKGEKLYKLVPPGKDTKYSPYWMTAEELQGLKGMSNEQIANKLGLPAQSLPKDGLSFMIEEIEAQAPTEVFVSKIAKTTEGEIMREGGGAQSLVTQKLSKFRSSAPPTPFR